jgi:DNA polymerase-3 subunit epsilon
MREIIFDTETTGFDPLNGDRMVEIGCIEMVGRVMTGATFHCYFNPERGMPSSAEAVHGLSDKFLSDKPFFAAKAGELIDFLGTSPLVAHNASFDFGFLNMELQRCGREPIDMGRMVDTIAIARNKHPGAKMSLDALCTRYGIDRSHRTKHGALLDAELLAQLYIELTGGKQIGLGFGEAVEDAGLESGAAASILPVNRPFRAPRPHAASAAELERHRDFIAGIKDALWNEGSSAASPLTRFE